MRKLDLNEFKICQILANIFEKSVTLSKQSSPMFIKRFMNCDESKCFFDKSYLVLSSNDDDIIYFLNNKYSENSNRILYTKNQMYWIGYIYGALSFLYNLNAKAVFKLFPSKEIVKYYNIYHTFDIEEAAERMMDNISYSNDDYTDRGVQIFKQIIYTDKLKQIIGKKVKVTIDDKTSIRKVINNIMFNVNYGHLDNITSLDGKPQDIIVIDNNKINKKYTGNVSAIIHQKDNKENYLLISNANIKDSDISKLLNIPNNITIIR